MRMLGIVLLAALLFGCNVAGGPSKPEDEVLFGSLNADYQPLKNCVDQKLRVSGKPLQAICSEIAGSDALSQVLLDEKEFLGTPSADILAATSREHVRLVIEALQRGNPYEEKSFMYRAWGLRRKIAATSIIARAPSIHCEQSLELGYWLQEDNDYEVLTNLWTFSRPYVACEDEHVASIGGRRTVSASAIVRSGRLPELKRLSAEYLDSSDPDSLLANKDNVTDAMRAQMLLDGLSRYVVGGPKGERYGVRVQRLMVTVLLERLEASATQSKCVTSPALAYWIETVAKRRNQK